MRVNLGCSSTLEPGYINVDICPPCDLKADLRQRWPWEDSTVEYIRAYDIIEHLPDKIHTMNEAWRVLKAGGIFDIFVPTTWGEGADQDPTHCSRWNRGSFLYHTVGIGEYDRFKHGNGVVGKYRVVSEDKDGGQWWPGYVNPEGVTVYSVHKLKIVLEAVK